MQVSVRRICLYCLYNKNGTIYDVDLFFLHHLRINVDYMAVIINGEIDNPEVLYSLADEIIRRDNEGFDALAYCNFLFGSKGKEFIRKYDELILCNSSTIGPFIPLKDIFECMSKNNCDFWGLSSTNKNLSRHIQSYFMVFRKKIITEKIFWNYFERYIVGKKLSYEDVCRVFENGLYYELVDNGYIASAYSEDIECNNYTNPYGSIILDRLPVIKKKIFSPVYYDKHQILNVIKWIDSNTDFDTNFIIKYAKEEYKCQLDKYDFHDERLKADINIKDSGYKVTWFDLYEYLSGEQPIYIYGDGRNAIHIFNSFIHGRNEDRFRGFIVSDYDSKRGTKKFGYRIFSIKEISSNSCIIVALSKENSKIVHNFLQGKNTFYLWDV